MSWSLQITDGDFRVDSAHLGTVVGQQKLVQDLSCAILERMGTDNLHPSYGSLIDGGRTPSGVIVQSLIGEDDLEMVLIRIESEITRIAQLEQQAQLTRAKADKLAYGKATLTPQEVLMSLNGIDFTQSLDRLNVVVHIETATGNTFDITVPLDANTS